MTTLTRYDYTVGWLCALPKSELVAAKQMLDYRHEPVRDLSEYDENTYTYGSINGHNIVIACLPPGQPGGASAARLVQPLSMSFPKMRVHLLVGVGGGVPRDPQPDNPDEDVRLGDVVVGWAEQTGHPAVVQYDYVRHEKGGDGELLGRLDNPHWIVLNALGALLANAYIETKFEEHLRKVCQSLEGFSRPCEDDYLYHKTYSHVSGQTCSACAPSSRVQRKARKSNHLIFHQGTILSGSSIMTDAETRDSLSKKYHDAKCFEMEAFGVMNQKHCLVIRGISDYSDSHKNQSWQKYAASTAAAFAREFLYTLQPHNASRMETMEDITSLEQRPLVKQSPKPHRPFLNLEKAKFPLEEPPTIYTVSNPKVGIIDVIFVHGLHGNAHQTWTDQNNTFFWPQQLGVDIPSARIITFGYSSSKFTDDAIPHAVGESAKALVDLLWGARKDHRNRPMIFVTEGLGGHIVQDTLLICQKSPYLKDLLSSVFAIIFFSTSYSGDGLMVSDYITAGSLGKPRKINKPTSNSLQAATTVASHTTVLDFEQLLLRSKIDVKTIDDKSEKMVESTALFEKSGPNISAKRQAMTAFTSRTDVRYKRVVETIRMWMYQV